MAEVDSSRHRKSVAFADDETLIDGNGDVTKQASENTENPSAESHSQNGTNGDAPVDDAAAAFDELALAKKKKKSSKKKEGEKEKEDGAEGVVEDEDLDLAAMKKKKKKKAPKTDDADDFEAKLAKAGATDKADEGVAEEVQESEEVGDMDEGTGIWAHDATQAINYNLLLSRFFQLLNVHNPDSMLSGNKSYKIPPPQCLREGNKKTIFANLADICKRMKRPEEHIQQFLFAELGTHGSTDGSRRLVIKGKFLQKQIENVLRRYILEYVSCKTCKSLDTEMVKRENRLSFIECNSCNASRSVQPIKTGFTAQVTKRRRQQG